MPAQQVLAGKATQRLIVVPQIVVEGINPLLAVVVGRLDGFRRKGVDVAHLVDVDGAVEPATRGSIAADDVGHHQSGYVERLRRRVQHNGISVDGTHRHKGVARHDQLAVNLVADDADTVATANVGHVLQLFTRPDAAGGVVRIAEQEDGRLLVGTLLLKVVPVDLEAAAVAVVLQHALKDFATVVADTGEEAVVVGREDQHPLAGHGQCLQCHRHGRHYARGVEHPLALDGPLVTPAEPSDDCIVVVVGHVGISEDGMLGPAAYGVLYGGCHGEVHVGHPQRYHFVAFRLRPVRHCAGGLFVPLYAARTSSLYHLIEIIVHSVTLFLSFTLLPFHKYLLPQIARISQIFAARCYAITQIC